ncbi:hypothetical protein QTU67_002632 [Vibrio cholerae]|uniref:Glycosyl hydrolase family 32 N-terminal domain-containing protein n=1 Tax=Vibrio cholerae TaxID=666 RepID=D6NLZ3_VIBCL|nr:hypothetical protein [Vibrio cholerae]ADF80978.1 hypothetical protein [Vibrio cholerae]EGQ7881099.1 hypothetical protein [Vibrio cholerae]EGQ9321831.1 hypothetical protein [Vibrio cholerae]EGQ9436444.1 hypothetical protein [Vibrio cholerae]EGQ9634390.1 hypothetical protein [Vibrio cholerae]
MKWKKMGLVYRPRRKQPWNQKYAILPVPEFIENENRIRIYFGSTDNENFGRISYIEVDADEPTKILYEHQKPVLDLGREGTFDDCGVVPSCLVQKEECSLLYTVGFQRCVKVPYMLFAGLAMFEKNEPATMKRYSEAPILERTPERPISQGAPWVLYENGKYRMWHWYGTKWIEVEGKPFIDYHIGYAESDDGYTWSMTDNVCLAPIKELGEFAVARPCVFKQGETYHMWYSVRLEKKMYRIAYATSKDGLKWIRHTGDFGLEVSDDGWDSEMMCYPAVIEVKGRLLMFFNGNNNGETGFGVAEAELND